MGSAIRVITFNRLYTGEVAWNKHKFIRNPESERIVRRARPKSDWLTSHDESVRIISDETFAKAQARSKVRSNADRRLKRGGKVRHLLSGLLKCDACGANFVSSDAKRYACSSYVNGGVGACSNKTRVRRDALERGIIEPIKKELLDPERVQKMAAKLQRQVSDHRAEVERRGAMRRVS
jgi:hypothetical protein